MTRTFNLTANGNIITGLGWVAGETVTINVAAIDDNGAAINLTNAAITATLSLYNLFSNPTAPAAVTEDGTITGSPAAGNLAIAFPSSDTEGFSGVYALEVRITDGTGNYFSIIPPSPVNIEASALPA